MIGARRMSWDSLDSNLIGYGLNVCGGGVGFVAGV